MIINKYIYAGKFNSIENQLKIIYYAAKDYAIKIKATEFKGKHIRLISYLWITVESIKYQRLIIRLKIIDLG